MNHNTQNISDSCCCQFLRLKNNNNIGSELALETFSVNASQLTQAPMSFGLPKSLFKSMKQFKYPTLTQSL